MKTIISVDSTGDLSDEIINKYNIRVFPLTINLGEDERLDGVTINISEMLEFVEKTKELPKTAARSRQEYFEYFSEILKEYDSIIHFSISKDMSASFSNANSAGNDLNGKVEVVDSRSLSTGIGILLLNAHDLLMQGVDFKTVAKIARESTSKVQASFVIENLKFLHKGGRCSMVALLGANLLKLRPSIHVIDGKMVVGKKYRGKYPDCLKSYVKDTLANFPNYDRKRVFLTYTPIDKNIIEMVREMLKDKFDEILETQAGATITCHCGPNTLGILFNNK